MSHREVCMALIIMICTIYCIRAVPFVIFRKEIKNVYIRSFLYYVPFVTLAVMTFPAILHSTSSVWSATLALGAGIAVSLLGGDLFTVAISACLAVFLSELFLI